MDVPDDEGDLPTNNGYESPMDEEESNTPDSISFQLEESTASETGQTLCRASCKKKLQNILDKSISIDEDSLIPPLEPTRASPIIKKKCAHISEAKRRLVSILRKRPGCDEICAFCDDVETFQILRRVSFPSTNAGLVTYKEPEASSYPFVISSQLSAQEILLVYKNSCKQNNTIELDLIKNQISEIKQNANRSATLKLSGISISLEVLETLEDLFKVANFRTISVINCKFTPALIADFLDIIEYYESATEIILSIDLGALDAWQLFCNLAASTEFIEMIAFKSITISNANMKTFMNAITNNITINTLKFYGCMLVKLPNFHLIKSLETNSTIRELYLPQTGLYTKEADCIGKLLTKNYFLKVLDISNNVIGDRGLEQLAKGLCKQTEIGTGLSVLIVFNNQLTEKSGKTIDCIIATCKNLHSLNIGFNKLTDSVITDIKESLKESFTLGGLGLQSTVLTCIGASALAEAIEVNNSLEQVNLKGNKAIYIEGLEKLSQALTNSRISKFDLDETNQSCSDRDGYSELVTKIKGICTINKSRSEQANDISRKISLNCEPYYSTPTPLPSTCGPAARTRSRFQVSKVPDPTQKT